MNEIEKALQRGNVQLVVLAHDTEPICVAQGFARECEDADVSWVYVPSRMVLGRAVGVGGSRKKGRNGVVAVAVVRVEGSELGGRVERMGLEVERLAL